MLISKATHDTAVRLGAAGTTQRLPGKEGPSTEYAHCPEQQFTEPGRRGHHDHQRHSEGEHVVRGFYAG